MMSVSGYEMIRHIESLMFFLEKSYMFYKAFWLL